jgi:hypothetical protein
MTSSSDVLSRLLYWSTATKPTWSSLGCSLRLRFVVLESAGELDQVDPLLDGRLRLDCLGTGVGEVSGYTNSACVSRGLDEEDGDGKGVLVCALRVAISSFNVLISLSHLVRAILSQLFSEWCGACREK